MNGYEKVYATPVCIFPVLSFAVNHFIYFKLKDRYETTFHFLAGNV